MSTEDEMTFRVIEHVKDYGLEPRSQNSASDLMNQTLREGCAQSLPSPFPKLSVSLRLIFKSI